MPTSSPHWTPLPPQPRETPGYRKGMVLRLVMDARDTRRWQRKSGEVFRLVRLLAPGQWETIDNLWEITVIAESVLDKCAEVISNG